jgi:hypothetical protein
MLQLDRAGLDRALDDVIRRTVLGLLRFGAADMIAVMVLGYERREK